LNHKPNKHKGEIIADINEDIKLLNCKKCKFIHQYPLPNKQEREKYYREKYFQETKKSYFKKGRKQVEYNKIWYTKKEEVFIRNLNSLPKKILDIGTGGGYFLNFLRKRDWKIKGIEPNKLAIKIAKEELDINLFDGKLEDFLEKPHGKFSVVHLSFVLEHIINPIDMIKKIKDELLFKGGIICIEVPNDFNPLQKIAMLISGNKWWIAKDHINYFNLKSLSNLLYTQGFQVIKNEVTFPMEFFILMGNDYVNEPEIGKKCHSQRVNFEQNLFTYNRTLKNEIYKSFKNLSIGRSIIIYGRNNS
jgi:2-polyprenyl-3-methyl-5-hydroxy-6-metoxy-1,4-benzoquinol methylase